MLGGGGCYDMCWWGQLYCIRLQFAHFGPHLLTLRTLHCLIVLAGEDVGGPIRVHF